MSPEKQAAVDNFKQLNKEYLRLEEEINKFPVQAQNDPKLKALLKAQKELVEGFKEQINDAGEWIFLRNIANSYKSVDGTPNSEKSFSQMKNANFIKFQQEDFMIEYRNGPQKEYKGIVRNAQRTLNAFLSPFFAPLRAAGNASRETGPVDVSGAANLPGELAFAGGTVSLFVSATLFFIPNVLLGIGDIISTFRNGASYHPITSRSEYNVAATELNVLHRNGGKDPEREGTEIAKGTPRASHIDVLERVALKRIHNTAGKDGRKVEVKQEENEAYKRWRGYKEVTPNDIKAEKQVQQRLMSDSKAANGNSPAAAPSTPKKDSTAAAPNTPEKDSTAAAPNTPEKDSTAAAPNAPENKSTGGWYGQQKPAGSSAGNNGEGSRKPRV